MANTVKVKRSATPSKVPTTSDLQLGEIAVNTYDGKMYIKKDDGTASVVQVGGGSGSGDVVGPASATDNAVARFDTTTGKLIQNSVVTVSDTGVVAGASISGASNTLSNIGNAALTNSSITINGANTSLGGSVSVGTVTSVAATAGTGISVSGSPITSSGTLTITNTAPDQVVAFTNGTGISVTGTYPNFTVTNTSPSSGGTVTSVTGTAPVVSSGGNTPAISMAAATASVNGYMTSTYAAKLDGIAAGATNVTNTNQLTNGAGFITGITSGMVTTALGYTPYNSTNPSGYITSSGSISGNAATATAAQGATFQTQPNAIWGAKVQIGGNGTVPGVANIAVVQATDGNLHMDAGTGKAMYLNYYNNGTIYLNGASYYISNNGSQYNGNSATATTASSCSGNAATVTSITSGQVTTALGYTPYSSANPSGYITSSGSISGTSLAIAFNDGPRNLSNRLPSTNPRSVYWDFVGAGTTGTAGNYAGVMTFTPWDGTSASTGDSSYQLGFGNQSGVNASGPPTLVLRSGINSTWNGWYSILSTNGATFSGNLTMSGNITAYSDETLKKDWGLVDSNFVSKLAKVKSGTYTRIDSNDRQAGVSAQDMQNLLSEVVLTDEDGKLSLAYGNAAMVSCVELAKVIEELRAEIAELKTKIKD